MMKRFFLSLALLFAGPGWMQSADAAYIVKNGGTSNVLRVVLANSSTGAALTGLTSASSGLIISTIANNEATATTYTVAGSTIETITTLGTFAAPTATKCRFKEVDSTNLPGLYELQLADARYAVSSAKTLVVCLSGATNLKQQTYEIELTAVDVQSANAFMTGVNSIAPPTNWNLASIDSNGRVDVIKIAGTTQTARDNGASVLISSGTGTGQLDFTSGVVKSNQTQILGTAVSTPATAGILDVNLKNIANAAVSASTAQLGVNVINFGGAAGSFASGRPAVNATYMAGAQINNAADANFVDNFNTLFANNAQVSQTTLDDILGAKQQATIAANAVDTEMGAVKAKTDSLTFTVANKVDSNVTTWSGTTVPTPDTAGYPKVTHKTGTGTGELSLSSGAVTVGTNNDKTAYALTSAGIDAILDRSISGHTTANTVGQVLNYTLASFVSSGVYSTASLANAPSGTGASASVIADAVWDEARSGHTTSGTFGEYVPANVTQFGGTAGSFSGGRPAVNATYLAGAQINDSADANFVDNFNTLYLNNGQVSQTLLDDILGAKQQATTAVNRLPSALIGGRIDASVGAMAANTLTAAATASDTGIELGTATWASATRTLTSGGGGGDADFTETNAKIDAVGATAQDAADAAEDAKDAAEDASAAAGAAQTAIAGVPSDVWSYLTSAATTANSLGKRLADNIDAPVSSAGGITVEGIPRLNKPPAKRYILKVSNGADRSRKAPVKVQLAVGVVHDIVVGLDLSPVYGNAWIGSVGTPTVSSGSLTATMLGPFDVDGGYHLGVVRLAGSLASGQTITVSVPVTMETGETETWTFDVVATDG